ncbi:MAG: hypothetical protein QOI49_2946, partial [Verrucomicrobiota bacterium]
ARVTILNAPLAAMLPEPKKGD